MNILFISGSEVFIVLIVVLLLFGSKKIPELAKGIGKGMKEFKRATEDIKKELNESTSGIRESANEIRRDIDQVKHKLEKDTTDIYESTTEIKKDIDKVKDKLEEPAEKETDSVSPSGEEETGKAKIEETKPERSASGDKSIKEPPRKKNADEKISNKKTQQNRGKAGENKKKPAVKQKQAENTKNKKDPGTPKPAEEKNNKSNN